jgi:alpha-beta hydrolase superfamily lysophospholipase
VIFLLIVFFVVGGIFFLGWRMSGLVLRGPREPLTTTPRTYGLAYSEERFNSSGNLVLRAWFVPSSRPSDTTLVICHGWGANRSNILERTHFLRSRGEYNLFFFDFRNHGESDAGQASLSREEIGDLDAALRHLRSVHPTESARMGLYGMSMGASIGIWVAAQDVGVLAVAAESPFCEFSGALTRHGRLFYGAPKLFSRLTLWFVRNRLGFDPNDYAPLRVVGKIAPRPLFILQGERDRRTPPAEGRRLFDAAGEPKTLWTVPGAYHGELAEVGGREYQDRILAFFDRAFHRSRP